MRKWKKVIALLMIVALILPFTDLGTSEAASGTWEESNGHWYFRYSDGTYAKGESWLEVDGKKYYLVESGFRAVSWKQMDGSWYYFGTDGVMTTDWFFISSHWLYFGTDGKMTIGWRKIGKFWYYFDDNGYMLTGWQNIKQKQYYFDDNGKMATGTVTISGKSYTFDENGVLVTGGSSLSSGAKVGDVVTFGNYEQDNVTSNGKEAIEWIVLDKYSDGSYLLVSQYGLDAKPYNDTLCAFTWDMCTLRTWLNGTFYNTAFSSTEKGKIKTTNVKNDDNFFWGTKGGSDTKDKVFLLSSDESKKYFVDKDGTHNGGDSTDRACRLTAYAIAQGGEERYGSEWWATNCWYWLRSPGQYQNYAAYVYRNGYVSFDYDGIDPMIGVVRPSIVVKP